MVSRDEPDFGFLNNEGVDSESPEQLSFNEPDPDSSTPEVSSDRTRKRPSLTKNDSSRGRRKSEKKPAPQSADALGKTSTGQVRSKQPKPGASDSLQSDSETVPKTRFLAMTIYAGVVSLVLLLQLLGIIQLGGTHQLESLPDVAPLKPGEFQLVPDTASLPPGHELRLGQEARFGDIFFTPTKVVRESLTFQHMTTQKVAADLRTTNVLKLHFTVRNASTTVGFPPWDVALMSHRSPMEGLDASTKANSWLMVETEGNSRKILNFFHSPKSSFEITGMQSRQVLKPEERQSTFVASSEGADEWLDGQAKLKWRIQLRKGIHPTSDHSVTTLVDVLFSESDVEG